jgi:membrane protein YdbS with pleckstrin-like domain
MMRGSKLDEIINLVFLILAIGAGICYFAVNDDHKTFLVVGGVAVVLKLVQYFLRFFK